MNIILTRKASRGGTGQRLSGPPQSQAAAPMLAVVQAHPPDRKVAARAEMGKHSLNRTLLEVDLVLGRGFLLTVVYMFCLALVMAQCILNHPISKILRWIGRFGACADP